MEKKDQLQTPSVVPEACDTIQEEIKEIEKEVASLETQLKLNFAGRLAKRFLQNPLTVVIALAVLLLGVVAVFFTPREENPQIDVPSASVIVGYPGADSPEVHKAIVEPLAKKLSELTGVDHIYGMAQNGVGVVTVQFRVGENKEVSLVKLYDRVMQNIDLLPKNATEPLMKPVDIDEVPIYTVALSSAKFDESQLYKIARSLIDPLASVPNVSIVGIKGGKKRQLNILLDPIKLSGYSITGSEIAQALRNSSMAYPTGELEGDKFSVAVGFDGFIRDVSELGKVIVAVRGSSPIYLSDVAAIEDNGEIQKKEHARFSAGLAMEPQPSFGGAHVSQATIFLSKKRGSNAVFVSNDIEQKLSDLKALLPKDVELVVTRNDGEKADHVVNELIFHIIISVAIIVVLLVVMLGWREALIVSLTIPLVLSITLFVGMLVGQTINRITLFALILSLGLLVDDAIVVIENIHRHFALKRQSKKEMVIAATNEVGNPTYVATVAVVFAFLPMLFVTGMMGPYMGPIPFNVPVAMGASLIIAFAFSPWLAYRFLKVHDSHEPFDMKKGQIYKFYDRFVRPMLQNRRKRYVFMFIVIALFLLSLSLPVFNLVQAKMLPGSNVNTFNITVDLPTSSSIAKTNETVQCVEDLLAKEPDIRDYESFVGTTGIVDFNGLLRGNAIKKGDHVAEIRVNLRDKTQRDLQSGEYVSLLRHKIKSCEAANNANIKMVEDPPGPPVLATLVSEIYGGDEKGRRKLASQIEAIYKKTEGVVDVDTLGEKPIVKYEIVPDRQKAGSLGITVESIAEELSLAMQGSVVSIAHLKEEKDPVSIFVRADREAKGSPEQLMSLKVHAANNRLVSIGDVAVLTTLPKDGTLMSKDLKDVVMVTGEMDKRGSVYAQFEIRDAVSKLDGYKAHWDGSPRFDLIVKDEATGHTYKVVMDGEWKVTFDTFRDLGSAFGVAVVLIYLLMVAYYGSFRVPGIILTTVPLTLVGIMPGHAIMNIFTPTFFTATSMIGFIALAGIVVRNAIMLVDFTNDLISQGRTIEEAVVEAAATRFRPILLTALAISLASLVIVLDPVWQGLAVSLIFGVMVATMLTLVVTPLLYWRHLKNNTRRVNDLRHERP